MSKKLLPATRAIASKFFRLCFDVLEDRNAPGMIFNANNLQDGSSASSMQLEKSSPANIRLVHDERLALSHESLKYQDVSADRGRSDLQRFSTDMRETQNRVSPIPGDHFAALQPREQTDNPASPRTMFNDMKSLPDRSFMNTDAVIGSTLLQQAAMADWSVLETALSQTNRLSSLTAMIGNDEGFVSLRGPTGGGGGGSGGTGGTGGGGTGGGGGGGGALHATNDTYNVLHDNTLNANGLNIPTLLNNDTLGNLVNYSVVVVASPLHGRLRDQGLAVNTIGTFQYLPDDLYVGNDSFSYYITDGTTSSNTATVSINVTNITPVATNDIYNIVEDQIFSSPAIGNVTHLTYNDHDNDNEPFSVHLVDEPTHGTISLFSDGTFEYTPDINYYGVDHFTYNITDGPSISNSATVTINISSPHAVYSTDIDGHDDSTVTGWMRESEEGQFGLQASTQLHSQAWIHESKLPVVNTRRITWDGTTIAINGSTTGIMNLSAHGDIYLDVSAVKTNYIASSINYELIGNLSNGLGVANVVVYMIVPKKVLIRNMDFKSDHKVLHDQRKLNTIEGGKYKVPQVDLVNRYAAPTSMTKDTKMQATLTLSWAGVNSTELESMYLPGNQGGQYEDGFDFKSVINFPGISGQSFVTPVLTARTNLPNRIDRIDYHLKWTATGVTNPNIATMGGLFMYVTYDKPRNPDNEDYLIPTEFRMDQMVTAFRSGYISARDEKAPAAPSPIRVLYNSMKAMQKFDLDTNKTDPSEGNTPKSIWEVPAEWQTKKEYKNPQDPNNPLQVYGVDCISNVAFYVAASYLTGLPGDISTVTVVPKVNMIPPEFNHGEDDSLYDTLYQLIDGASRDNNFEACVEYGTVINGNNVNFYITGGETYSYNSMDKVLTLFNNVSRYPLNANKGDVSKRTEMYSYVNNGGQQAEDKNFGD